MTGYSVLTATPLLEDLIRQVSTCNDAILAAELQQWLTGDKKTVTFDLVHRAHREVAKSGSARHSLHELVMDSSLSLPEYTSPPRSPQVEARLAKIQAQVEEKEYRRMVKDVDRQGSMATALKFGLEVSSMNRQLWTVINFMVTVIGSFTFGYFAAHFADLDTTACVLLGLLFGIVVFLADLYFLVRNPDVVGGQSHKNKTKKQISIKHE